MRWFLSLCLLVMCLAPFTTIMAQSNFIRYENPDLGIALQVPSTWTVRTETNRLTAGYESDLNRLDSGLLPQNLVLLIRMATYNDLGLENVSQLPQKVSELVLPGVASDTPTAINYGNITGYQTEFTVTQSALTTRVALLAGTDGRVMIVRGVAPQQGWTLDTAPLLAQIMPSLEFTVSTSMATPLDSVPDDDGGVLWHYQTRQTSSQRSITLGGIAYDSTGVLYIAAGARGFMALNQATGEFINFLGPIFGDDNFTDVSLSPDLKLYFSNATSNPARRIMVIDRAGNYQGAWGVGGNGAGEFAEGMPRTIAVSKAGDVWTVSERHTEGATNRIYRFDKDGNLLATFDMAEISPDLHNVHLDIDRVADRVYVVGEQGGIAVLSWQGQQLAVGLAQAFLDQAEPLDISLGSNGMFMIATRQEGLIEMNTAGIVIDRFGYAYDTERGGAFLPAEYLAPNGIVIDNNLVGYFAETHPDTGFVQVQAITFSGQGNLAIAQRSRSVTEVEAATQGLSSGGDISYGNVVHGILSNTDPRHDYTFSATAGDQIQVTLKAGPTASLDTLLVLFDNNFNRLADNDDVGVGVEDLRETDSRLVFTFSRNGNYIIRVSRFGGQGEYELILTRQ
ncbi:MAG: pre-peptidase C-terminal domain-containing protein [Anaerolineales bacterium]|nr:pre-peptidase C-terminal domain-containing protein [Anaerolineales bacterium]